MYTIKVRCSYHKIGEKMSYINRLNQLFHRAIDLNTKNKFQSDMTLFLKLNPLDQAIMNIIFEKNNISISHLTKILNKSKSTMTSAINRLEKQQLIKRKKSKVDKRVFNVFLTHLGIKLQNSHHQFENNLYHQILSALKDSHEKEIFLELLEKIINKFEQNMKENTQ